MEEENERLKTTINDQQRKIDDLERQSSNEKHLRSTISKLQSDIETKCAETQKWIVHYKKQLKSNGEEFNNFRRKFRTNEEKVSLLVQKVFEFLRLTRILNETNSISSDNHFPTSKQLDEFKLYIEQTKTSKIEQLNEVKRPFFLLFISFLSRSFRSIDWKRLSNDKIKLISHKSKSNKKRKFVVLPFFPPSFLFQWFRSTKKNFN